MRTLVERYPTIGVNIISYLSRRLRDAESELESMAYQRVGQRLARKLVDLSNRFGVKTSRGTLIEARLTQQELAEMIGTTRETLAHTLADFRKRGLLDTEKHQVLIRDAEQLMDIAEGLDRPRRLKHRSVATRSASGPGPGSSRSAAKRMRTVPALDAVRRAGTGARPAGRRSHRCTRAAAPVPAGPGPRSRPRCEVASRGQRRAAASRRAGRRRRWVGRRQRRS